MKGVLRLIFQFLAIANHLTFSSDHLSGQITLIVPAVHCKLLLTWNKIVGSLLYSAFEFIATTTTIQNVEAWSNNKVFKSDAIVENEELMLILRINSNVGVPFESTFS